MAEWVTTEEDLWQTLFDVDPSLAEAFDFWKEDFREEVIAEYERNHPPMEDKTSEILTAIAQSYQNFSDGLKKAGMAERAEVADELIAILKTYADFHAKTMAEQNQHKQSPGGYQQRPASTPASPPPGYPQQSQAPQRTSPSAGGGYRPTTGATPAVSPNGPRAPFGPGSGAPAQRPSTPPQRPTGGGLPTQHPGGGLPTRPAGGLPTRPPGGGLPRPNFPPR